MIDISNINDINSIDDAIEYIKADAIAMCTEDYPMHAMDPIEILFQCGQNWGDDPKGLQRKITKLFMKHYNCDEIEADEKIYDIELEAVADLYGLTVPMLKVLSATHDISVVKLVYDNAIDKDKLKRMIKLYLDNNVCTEYSPDAWKKRYSEYESIINE